MREIRFRGKRVDNGEWVYGGIFVVEGGARIVVADEDGGFQTYRVDPVTVGQWTGLKDADGQDIYVGDIVEWWIFPFDTDLPGVRERKRIRDTVVFSNGVFGLATRCEILAHKLNPLCELRRIGNTHELLEGSHAD